MAKYYLPSIGGQMDNTDKDNYQSSPLLNTYSPRLFGSPPQLTHLNDMRLMSSDQTDVPGPVGDYYLTGILQNAQIANFVVGKALFTGGMSSIANIIRTAAQYGYALSKYDILGENDTSVKDQQLIQNKVLDVMTLDAYNKALGEDTGSITTTTAGAKSMQGLDENTTINDLSGLQSSVGSADSIIADISNMLGTGGELQAAMLTSMSVQQPYYTFESDWFSYINNVKMMINTAVIMLGLQKACVRIGDQYLPIGMDVNVKKDTDVWSNYRFITANKGLGTVTGIDTQAGDTTQYVSFMIQPNGNSETLVNKVGQSQLFSSAMDKGSSVGSEIAFITNSSSNAIDDAVINLASQGVNAAESVLSALTGGVGRFTAAIAGSMARSFVGDHTIYPDIFLGSEFNSQNYQIKTTLNATSGDPYGFLTGIWVPLSFILGMAAPEMSKNNASAYTFPPLIQCNIPGMWGTRLGMITQVEILKNPNGNDVSINGYPTSVDITMTIADLQHTIVTSPMNKPAVFLNNNTMFDYIAQCAGVDKYRVNGSVRLVAKLALASSAMRNVFHNIGDAVLSDFASFANRMTGTGRY